MNCLIVDDEEPARDLLASYVDKIPDFSLAATCENALQAKAYLAKHQVDILFLDIQMPDLTGIELVKSMGQKPLTVFTTAYGEYALEGYRLDIIDYLVKPIPFNRFFEAVQKAADYHALRNSPSLAPHQQDYFFVKSGSVIVKVIFEKILYIEGMSEYVRIHTEDDRVMTLLPLHKLLEILPTGTFFRIHRSYVVNTGKIDKVDGNMVQLGKQQLPVSRALKKEFIAHLNGMGLF